MEENKLEFDKDCDCNESDCGCTYNINTDGLCGDEEVCYIDVKKIALAGLGIAAVSGVLFHVFKQRINK